MELWLTSAVAIVVAIGASSGFWSFLQRRDVHKSATTRLLLGLAHDRIVYLGVSYIDRGWVTKDEYEDLVKYLYAPYSEFGGNGLAEKVMSDVAKLPMRGAAQRTVIEVTEDKHV